MTTTTRAAAFNWRSALALALAIVVLDQWSKRAISAAFQYGQTVPVTSFFNLVLVHNKGAAFSFLADAGGWQRWFFTAVTLVISAVLVWMLRRQHANRLLAVALALVLGGAIGNLWDRVTLGHVVDFVQLHAAGYSWPAFNVADSAISVGVGLLLWDSVRPGHGAATVREKP